MVSFKAILMMCAIAAISTPTLAQYARFHNNCGYDVSLKKSGIVVSMRHPHFQCGWADTLDVLNGMTRQVPLWSIESFVSGVYDAYDGNGYKLPKMSYTDVKCKIVQERKDNGIKEPGCTEGAMLGCSALDKNSYFFDVTSVPDVYLCKPEFTGNKITIVNKCTMPVRVSVFGKEKKGNFACSPADSQEIQAGKMVQMPVRQFEKLYLATDLPNDDPYTPTEKPIFFGKKKLAKLSFIDVTRGSHYKDDGDCDDPPGNKYSPIVSPSSKYMTYSLCRPI